APRAPFRGEGGDGGTEVLDHVVDVDLAADGAPAVDVLRSVAALEAALGAIEDGRGEDDVAVGREAVRYLLDMGVDAEDLLDDDDACLGLAGGGGTVGAARMTLLRLWRGHLTPAGILRGRPGQGPARGGDSGGGNLTSAEPSRSWHSWGRDRSRAARQRCRFSPHASAAYRGRIRILRGRSHLGRAPRHSRRLRIFPGRRGDLHAECPSRPPRCR